MNARSIIERFHEAQREGGTSAGLGILDRGIAELRDAHDLGGVIQVSRVASVAAEHLGDAALAARYLYGAPEPESALWQLALYRLLQASGQIEQSRSHLDAGIELARKSGDPRLIELFRGAGL
ncbi:MAG: hypothetical protein QM757_43090 [Paludibaculum sp.]